MNVGPLDPDQVPRGDVDRHPIRTAATEIRNWVAVLSAFVTAAGTGGLLLTSDQVTALQGVIAAVVPLVSAVLVVLTAFGIVKRSEPLVTPMIDPRDNDGTKLVAVGERPSAGGVLR